jgi:hypothetical protein
VSEPVPHIEYSYGDVVRMRLSFTHPDVVFSVEVVYAHSELRTYTLSMEGSPESEEGSPPTGPNKRSTVDLTGGFDGSHIPGVYGIERVLFHTYSGTTFHDDVEARTVRWRTLELLHPAHVVRDLEVEFDDPGTD